MGGTEHIRACGLLSTVQDEFSTVLGYLKILGLPCKLQVEPKGSEAGD